MVPHLSFVRGSPHDLMRPNEAGMLTKIRSLFLIRSAARWRKALRDAGCPRTGRLASKHRVPPQSVGAALRAVEAPDIC